MQAGLLKKNPELRNLFVKNLEPPLNSFAPNFQFGVVFHRLFRSPSIPVGLRLTLKDSKRMRYPPDYLLQL